MASLYDSASLVMIPSGYKDDKLFSIKPTDGSGDFTFSRDGAGASPATRVNASGLIEKGRENLLTYSNTFINAVWIKSGASVTSGQSGYDGSSDAWALTTTATAGSHRVYHSSVNSSGIVTCSVYAKANGYSHLFIYANTPSGTDRGAYFDLLGGSVGTQTNKIVDATITSVGGGWYRCDVKQDNSLGIFELYVGDGENISFTGDGTSGILIQDAQVENGLVSTSYIETTTAPVSAGLLGDMPRLDYSGGATCPSLLLEPSRVNSVINSEYTGGIAYNNLNSLTNNAGISPEGVQNAMGVDATANDIADNYNNVGPSVVATFSVFAKAGTGDSLGLNPSSTGSNALANFDLTNGTITSTGYGQYIDSSIEDYGNGWYRCSITFTTGTGSYINRMRFYDTGTYEIFGMQLESGSYVSSYIPTYGSASTRAHDVCLISGANATAIIDKPAMTLYAEIDHDVANTNTTILSNLRKTSGGSYGDFISFIMRNNSQFQIEVRSNNTAQGTIQSSAISSGTHKVAAVVENDNLKLFVDGVLQGTDTSVVLPTGLNEIYLGGYPDTNVRYGTKNQYLYFPTALTDAECIALTTI